MTEQRHTERLLAEERKKLQRTVDELQTLKLLFEKAPLGYDASRQIAFCSRCAAWASLRSSTTRKTCALKLLIPSWVRCTRCTCFLPLTWDTSEKILLRSVRSTAKPESGWLLSQCVDGKENDIFLKFVCDWYDWPIL